MSRDEKYTVRELVDGSAETLRDLFPPQANPDGSVKTSLKKFSDAKGRKYEEEVPLLVNRSALIRGIIRAEKRHCDEHGKPEVRTIRDFWYSHIKVPLKRAEGKAAMCDGWGREASLALSSVFSEMVLRHELRYIDLNIEDKSREIAEVKWYKPHPFSKVVVFVEKEATFDRLKPVTDTYNVALLTGMGFVATAALEGMILKLEERGESQEDYTILLMADYDAYGFKIGEDLSERFNTLGLHCKVQRCAIYPNQVSKDVLLNKTFSIPVQNPYDKDWCKKYGITSSGKLGDQKDKQGNITEMGTDGIELQALEGNELRAILIETLKKYAPESEMLDAVIAQQKENADTDATTKAAEQYLRDLNDVRYRIIKLSYTIIDYMRDSIEVDERKIRAAVKDKATEMVFSDEFDEHLHFDTDEMLKAAMNPDADFQPDVDRESFVKEISTKLAELAAQMKLPVSDMSALEAPHDMIVEANKQIRKVLKR